MHYEVFCQKLCNAPLYSAHRGSAGRHKLITRARMRKGLHFSADLVFERLSPHNTHARTLRVRHLPARIIPAKAWLQTKASGQRLRPRISMLKHVLG